MESSLRRVFLDTIFNFIQPVGRLSSLSCADGQQLTFFTVPVKMKVRVKCSQLRSFQQSEIIWRQKLCCSFICSGHGEAAKRQQLSFLQFRSK